MGRRRRPKHLRNPLVRTAQQRVDNMAAVQLAHRKQVERGGEHADPCGARDRMQIDIGRRDAWENHLFQQPLKGGHAQLNRTLVIDARNDF